MALFNKVINIIMPEEYTPEKKIDIKMIVVVTVILILLFSSFVNIDFNTRTYIDLITVEQLKDIPGIGPYKAIEIHDYINTYGFDDYEDLLIINGIGNETIETLKKYTRK